MSPVTLLVACCNFQSCKNDIRLFILEIRRFTSELLNLFPCLLFRCFFKRLPCKLPIEGEMPTAIGLSVLGSFPNVLTKSTLVCCRKHVWNYFGSVLCARVFLSPTGRGTLRLETSNLVWMVLIMLLFFKSLFCVC